METHLGVKCVLAHAELSRGFTHSEVLMCNVGWMNALALSARGGKTGCSVSISSYSMLTVGFCFHPLVSQSRSRPTIPLKKPLSAVRRRAPRAQERGRFQQRNLQEPRTRTERPSSSPRASSISRWERFGRAAQCFPQFGQLGFARTVLFWHQMFWNNC